MIPSMNYPLPTPGPTQTEQQIQPLNQIAQTATKKRDTKYYMAEGVCHPQDAVILQVRSLL